MNKEANALRGAVDIKRSMIFAFATVIGAAQQAHAFEIDMGDPDLRVRWDNTIKYSNAWRVKDQNSKLVDGASALNQDDGDRNFDKGLISNRLDLLSEFDVTYKNFGARLSGAAWYDDVYNRSNDNSTPSRVNSYSVDYDEFTKDTRDLHGRDAEILDAFVFAKGEIAGFHTSARLGQYAMQWGESLFYGMNAIAGGMAPIDVVKGLSVPNTQFKELIRPVQQVSGQIQLTPDVSLGAYYQFKYESSRLPGAGSYFGQEDFFGEGSERLLVSDSPIPGGAPIAFFHGKDKVAKDSGQGGLQLRWRTESVDWGLYAIRFHDKAPQFQVRPNFGALDLETGKAGEYYMVYPEGIEAAGASFSTTVNQTNIAGEISTRWNQPLASTSNRPLLVGEAIDNDRDPLYATGRTLHANLSWLHTLEPSFIAAESSLIGELAWNRTLSVTKSPDAIDPNSDRDAWAFRFVYEPTYRQIFPGLDISVPMGMSYTHGRSRAIGIAFGADRGGDMNIGINGTYHDTWKIGLNYTHYYGAGNTGLDEDGHYTFQQALKDRDFVAFSISRTL